MAIRLPAGFIAPCQPVTVAKPPAGPGWIHEIKYDGYRLMALRDASGIRLLTRKGNDWTARLPLIAATVGKLKARSCLIDGELAKCDENGLPVFDLLRRGPRTKTDAALYAFDLLELDGKDLRREPVEVRKRRLKMLLRAAAPAVQLVEHTTEDGAVVFAHACAMGCEGIVSKRLGSRYVSGRSDTWLKIKNPNAPAVKRESEEDWNKPRRR